MKIEQFKKEIIRDDLEIRGYGRIFSFIDFANVNKWFQCDNQDWNNNLLEEDEYLAIDLNKLKDFSNIISDKTRLYYGEDPKNEKSLKFTYIIRKIFGKRNIITKDVQKIKHYIETGDNLDFKIVADEDGRNYVEIRKCNFDV